MRLNIEGRGNAIDINQKLEDIKALLRKACYAYFIDIR